MHLGEWQRVEVPLPSGQYAVLIDYTNFLYGGGHLVMVQLSEVTVVQTACDGNGL